MELETARNMEGKNADLSLRMHSELINKQLQELEGQQKQLNTLAGRQPSLKLLLSFVAVRSLRLLTGPSLCIYMLSGLGF